MDLAQGQEIRVVAVISAILSWLSGGIIGQLGKELREARKQELEAQNDHERLEAEKRVKELEAARDILIAEQGNFITRSVRPLFAIPFILFVWKVVVWDTLLGQGTTPHLSEEMYHLMWIIVGAYFLGRTVEKIRKG